MITLENSLCAFFITLFLLSFSPTFSYGDTPVVEMMMPAKPGRSFENSLGMKMHWVDAGVFTMGTGAKEALSRKSERPAHQVFVRNGFWIGETEVSQQHYVRLMRENPSRLKSDDHPVSSVTFEKAREFCTRLNTYMATEKTLPDGYQYNLPTEVQWEYAARITPEGLDMFDSQTQQVKGWNSDSILTGDTVLFSHRSCGSSPSGNRGLYDLSGNVWEWCLDDFHDNYAGAADDERPWLDRVTTGHKVIRGGSYLSLPQDCYPTRRISRAVGRESESQGFRVVLSVKELYSLAVEDVSVSLDRSEPVVEKKNIEVVAANGSDATKAIKGKSEPSAADVMKNSIGMRLVWVPEGKFDDGRGNNGQVSQGFWMGACEVTQSEYQQIMKGNPSHFKGDDRPVENVSYGDCQRFCKALSEKENRNYRLPAVDEWRHALLSGTSNPLYGSVESIGWVKGLSRGRSATKPVGLKKANGFGLFDMIGNVAEWTDSSVAQIKGFGGSDRLVPGFVCASGNMADMEELLKKTKCGGGANSPKGGLAENLYMKTNPGEKDAYTGFRVVFSEAR